MFHNNLTPPSQNVHNHLPSNFHQKVIVENKIPYLLPMLREIPGLDIHVLAGSEITPETVRDADAMFVRTRERCGAPLLEGSRVKFIGTATIGMDHFDRPWLAQAGINAVNAPGCNAPAVAQWVFAAANQIVGGKPLAGLTIAVIGVGNVGSIVSDYARRLGMTVIEVDPPRGLPATLDDAARRADIITFHTPLTRDGDCPTYHLFDRRVASLLKPGAIVLNAARGAVADTEALVEGLAAGRFFAGIDVWEGEPRTVDHRLLRLAQVATPHIAGYSLQGKQRAALMTLNAFRRHIGLDEVDNPSIRRPSEHITQQLIADSFDIMAVDRTFRNAPDSLEELRDTYILRDEA